MKHLPCIEHYVHGNRLKTMITGHL